MTRLLDRMEDAGLIARARDTVDRRLVTTRITPAGLKLLEELDGHVQRIERSQIGHMSEAQLRSLIELLAVARAG